jgi:hypothetical protein
MMGPDVFVARCVQERDEALLSLDADRILKYMEKYAPEQARALRRYLKLKPVLFWASVHKARCMVTTFSPAIYCESAGWLKEHHFEVPMRSEHCGR